jgi:hypothetical protein
MLTTVRAYGDELVSLQAVDAAVATWDRSRAKPRLAAAGAFWTELY